MTYSLIWFGMGFDRKLGTLVGFKFRKSDIYLGLDELLWVPDLLFSRSITTGPGLAYDHKRKRKH